MAFDWSAVASAGNGLLGNILNFISAKKTNDSNEYINQRNIDYNASMTQAQWERDDNAHQREVEDLKKAGLSPLASTNGALNSQAISAPSPIAMQAPQIDVNSLVQSALGSAQLDETKRHNLANEKYNSGRLENETKELELRSTELNIENKKVEAQIKYNARIIKLQNDELDEKIRATKKSEELRLNELEQKKLEEETTRLFKEIKQKAGGDNIKSDVINDYDIYLARQKLWTLKFNNFIKELQDTRSASGSSSSQSFGFGAGGSTVGTGAQGNAQGSSSSSQHNYNDISQKQQAMLSKFYQDNPIPVYISKEKYPTYYRSK